MLVGAALYVDESSACLSLCLQIKSLKSLAEQDPLQWQLPKLVCSRVKDKGEEHIYQGAVLQGFSESALSQC